MKRRSEKWFAVQSNVDFWDTVYEQPGLLGDGYRRRRALALSWLEASGLPKTASILEAGCGPGGLANEVAKRDYHVTGLDQSFDMLLRAAGKRDPVDKHRPAFTQGRIESLPLRDSCFDAVICLGVVAYLPSETTALQELARVLRPGGLLVISIYNRARLVHYLDIPLRLGNFRRRLLKRWYGSRETSLDTSEARPPRTAFYIRDFRNSLERAGFTAGGFECIPVEVFTLFGKEILPRKIGVKLAVRLQQSAGIPFFESFGAMCVFKAHKNAR